MLVVKLGNVTRVGASNFSFNNKVVRDGACSETAEDRY